MLPAQRLLLTLHLLAAPLAIAQAQTIAFEPTRLVETGHVPEPIAVGDFNLDGKLDAAIANTAADGESGGDNVTVLLGNGNVTFTRAGEFQVNQKRPEGVAVADLTGDGKPDILTANYGSSSLSVLPGDGQGGFGAPIVTSVPGGPRFVAIADFDGDGSLDVASANYDDNSVSILKGYDSGNFTISKTVPVGKGPEMLAVANLNGDSAHDLVACNRLDNSITPLRGEGNGNMIPGDPYEVGQDPRFLLASDLNGDGFDEVIVANNDSHTITIEQIGENLTFTRVNTLSFSTPNLTLREPVYLALADMTGDGDEDILVSYADSNLFGVWPQSQGAFNYGTPSAVQTGGEPVGIAAADFDGDGDPDVLVTNAFDDNVGVYESYLTAPGVIVDNGAAGTTAVGPWAPSDAPFPFGKTSLFSKDGTRYSWEAPVSQAGQYEVLIWWTLSTGRSSSIPVEVAHADGRSSLFLDQTRDIGLWHSLGVYSLTDRCVVTLTCPQDSKSVSADAIRLRPLPGASQVKRGNLGVQPLVRPSGYRISKTEVLAFLGRVTADNDTESEDIVAALFSPIGPGSESSKIAECRLYVDVNKNGKLDDGDRQLGNGRSFASDIRTVVFDGFRETITDGAALDLLVVAQLAPAAVAQVAPRDGSGAVALAMALGAAALVVTLLPGRRALLRRTTFAFLAAGLFGLAFAGCKSGGGGGSSSTLQLQLTSVVSEGQASGTPSTSTGLPAAGWRF